MAELSISNLPDGPLAIVDDEDYQRASKLTWTHNKGSGKGCIHNVKKCGSIHISLANFIMDRYDTLFDHKDRNPFNNRKSNLRVSNGQQNLWNRAKWTQNTSSKYKGVALHRPRVWRAKIMKDRKSIHLGLFKTEEAAALAYNAKAIELFGEFACLNEVN